MPLTRVGVPRCGIFRFRVLDPFRPQAHQHFGAQGGNFGPHHCFSFTGPPNYDRYRQHYSCSLYQETGRDPFHGGIHSHTLLCLVVDLFLWLQTQDIAIRARHIPGCLNVKVLQDVGNSNTGHACLPQSTTRIFPSLCLQSQSLEHWR